MTENKPSSEKRIKIDPFYPRLVAAGLLAAAGAYFFVPYRGPVSALFLAVVSAALCAPIRLDWRIKAGLFALFGYFFHSAFVRTLTDSLLFALACAAISALCCLCRALLRRRTAKNVLLALLPAAAAVLRARTLKAARENQSDVLRFGALTLAMSAAITALSFVLLEGLYLNRYWIPLMTLGAPVMAACLSRENNAPLRNVCVLLFAGVVVVSSAMQIAGSMKNPEITSVQRERAAHLQNNGLTFGYATFWNANVVTELTDGDVEAVAVSIDANAQGQGVPHTSMWLEATADRRMERPDEPVFLMLTAQESGQLSDFLALSGAQKRWEQSGMTIYEIESQRVFFETAQTMDAQ